MPRMIWITFGLIAGFFARTIAGKRGPKGLFDIVLAIIGALIGGWLFGFFDYTSTGGVVDLGERNVHYFSGADEKHGLNWRSGPTSCQTI